MTILSLRITKRFLMMLCLTELCSCSKDSMGIPGPDGGGPSDGGNLADMAIVPTATRFLQTATHWAVPIRGVGIGYNQTDYYVGPYWRTQDLNGDGQPDLINTYDPTANTVWGGDGAAYWKVYFGTRSGFAQTASQWAVPSRGVSVGYIQTDLYIGPYWRTLDLNGDGRPDLIDTYDSAAGTVWGGDGTAYWKVYLNSGTGFSRTAIEWPVPSRGLNVGYHQIDLYVSPYWRTQDLNGDGRPDLISTYDSAANTVWGGDTAAYWKVYLNSGTGFSQTATNWPVPRRGASDGYYTNSNANGPYWNTNYDLNGDGRLDLVDTYDSAASTVWGGDVKAYWKVYLNSGTGFSQTVTKWSVPSLGVSMGYGQPDYYVGPYWRTQDLSGDGLPDLINTYDSAANTVWGGDGAAYWQVYLGTRTGFSPTASHWPIPSRGMSAGYSQVDFFAGPYWRTLDLNGDHWPDLVNTYDPAMNTVWGGDGAAYWQVYLATP